MCALTSDHETHKLITCDVDHGRLSTEGIGGYFRGRYRESLETPKAIEAGKSLLSNFALPTANHVFLSGHRVMVQVQSSWFPLYDRNPQSFVQNIFWAKPRRLFHSESQASFVELPVVVK